MSKFTTDDRIANERENWKMYQAALRRVRERLTAEGKFYPIWNRDISYLEFYSKIREYSDRESKYLIEEIRTIKNKIQQTEPKNNWNPYKEQ